MTREPEPWPLARLVAEQERDDRFGHRVQSISLDAMSEPRRHRVLTRTPTPRPQLEAHARRVWWLGEAARCAAAGAESLARSCRAAAMREPHSHPVTRL